VLTTGNVLLPFCLIDLHGGAGYLRVISPHQRKPLARKILLADDSVTAQNMGRKILADAGYEVITVNNGSAALKKIAEQKPDLIILDVYMPGYSGLEVCQRLKEAKETARTPVLLTVGKLEPFKPDEAKRVGAEGFIVKPFEASELLSTLSKLEDKIVPRSENSKPGKPGRFARAIASVEESSRFGKTAPSDDESGWKSRIAFPPTKKEKPEEENEEGPAIYNAMNRDLRTVVDPTHPNKVTVANLNTEERRKEDRRKEEGSRQEGLVDVAALATPGMPKDVTPDEIAAIAAAAAQVQATISSTSESAEVRQSQTSDSAVEPSAANQLDGTKTEDQSEGAEPKLREESAAAGATLVENKNEEKLRATPEVVREDLNEARVEDRKEKEEDRKEESVGALANPAELMAALASLEPANGHSWHTVHSGTQSEESSEEAGDVPVTMAVASVAGSLASRWTVVPMAIDPGEAAISLEHEMKQAYAAFVAAEKQHSDDEHSEDQHRRDEPLAAATQDSPLSGAEPGSSVASLPEPELANAANAVADAAADAVGGAATELVAVATSYTEAQPALPAETLQTPASVGEASSQTEAAAEPTESVSADDTGVAEPVKQNEESRHSVEQTVSDAQEETFATNAHESQPESSPIEAGTAAPNDSAVGRWTSMGEKKESDLVATTAAAWASWRQIRDTSNLSRNTAQAATAAQQEEEDNEPAHSPESALAVAAGAENRPEEAPAASSAESKAIANIVDSVLAELRPKIAEEIARKLSADKK
jgi:CheY-like chemotaxis protein